MLNIICRVVTSVFNSQFGSRDVTSVILHKFELNTDIKMHMNHTLGPSLEISIADSQKLEQLQHPSMN